MSDSEGHDPGEGRNHSDAGTAVGRSANGYGTGGFSANPMSRDAATAATNAINGVGSSTVSSNSQTLGIGNVIGMMGGKDMSADSANQLQSAGWGSEPTSPTQTVDNTVAARNMDSIMDRAINFVPGMVQARTLFGLAGAAADPNKSFPQALGDAATSFASNSLIGKANAALMGAVGPAVSGAVDSWNSIARDANTISPGAVASINPAKSIANNLAAASRDSPSLDRTAYGIGGFSNSGGGDQVAQVADASAIPAAPPIPTKEENTAIPRYSMFGGILGNKLANRSAA